MKERHLYISMAICGADAKMLRYLNSKEFLPSWEEELKKKDYEELKAAYAFLTKNLNNEDMKIVNAYIKNKDIEEFTEETAEDFWKENHK